AAAGSNNRGNELVDTLRNRLKNNQSAEIIDLSIFDMDDRQLGLQDLRWKKAFDALKAIANDLLADEIDRWGEEFADVLTQLEALTSEKTTDKHLLSQQLVTGQYTQNRIIRSDKVPAKLQQAVADLRKEIKLYALWYEDFTADADRGISLHTLGDPAQTGYTRNILQKAEAQIHQVISQWSDIEDAHYQKLIALHLAQLDDEQLPQFLEDALPDGASIFRDIETGIKKRIAQFQQTDKNKAKYENVLALISARQADRAATELRDLLRKNPTDTGHRETLKATLDEMFDAALQQDLSDAASFIRIIEPDLRYASTYHDDDIKISDYHRKIRARVAGQIQNNVGGLINALATRKIIVLDTLSGLTTLTDNERQQLGDNLSEDLYNSELPSASSRSQLDLLLNNIEVFEKRIVAEFDETAFSDTWQHWKNKYTHEFESWLKDKLTKSRKLDHTLWMVTALKQLRAISSSQNAHNTVEDYSTLENLLNELYDVQYYDEETAPLVDQTGILSQQLGLNLGYLEMITEAPPPPPEPEAAPVSEVPGNSRRQPAPGILIGIVTVFVLIAGVALFALSQATSDTEAASSTETAIAQAQANITPVITAEIIPETLTHTPTETVTDAPTETPTIAPSPTEIPPTLIPLSPGDDAITVAGKDSSLTFNVLENDAGSNYSLSQLNLSDDFEYDAISMIEVSRSDKIGELIVTVIDVNGTDKIETFADIITDEPLVIGYTISNPKDGGEASASLTINLNSLPVVPQNITVDTDEDTSVLINLIGEDRIDTQENRIIGLNITDADGETIVLDLDNTAPPRSISGTLDVVSDTQLRYTPNENVNGGDTILFKITDATDSINVSIPVTINAINDAPIVNNEAINAQKITTNEDTPFSFDGLAYVTDVDVDDVDDAGDTLSIQLMSDQLLQRGSLEQDPANPDRIIYTPSPDYFGQDTIRYSVIDSADQRIEVTLDIDVVSVLDLNEINPPVIDVSLPDYIAPLFDQFTMPYKVRYPGPLAFDGNDSTKIIIDIETNIIAGRDVPMGDRPGEEIIHRNGPRLSIHGRYLDTERETWY
ncbi:MAG: Ig-like domain-containing protein, partial [Aggregatilineales bacterium]